MHNLALAVSQRSHTSQARQPLPPSTPPSGRHAAAHSSPPSPHTPTRRGLPPHRRTPPRRRTPFARTAANRRGGARTARLERLHDLADTLAADQRQLVSIERQRLAAEEEFRSTLRQHNEAVAYHTFCDAFTQCSWQWERQALNSCFLNVQHFDILNLVKQ